MSQNWLQHQELQRSTRMQRAGRSDNSARSLPTGMKEIQVGDEYDNDEEFDVHQDAADAHRQVMEMSATIEILTRDFENLQRELLDAYKKIQEYSDSDPRLHPRSRQSSSTASPSKMGTSASGGIVASAIAKLRTGNHGDCSCGQGAVVQELKQIISVKDTALTEALCERNEYKVRLERAEAMLRELQVDVRGGTTRSGANSGLHVNTSSRAASFSGGTVPYGMASTSPVNITPSVFTSSPPSGASTTSSSGRELPKHERFDTESTYQPREGDELFWRRQYRDAVRMRKHNAPPSASISSQPVGGSHSSKPSLKIFYPSTNRQRGITDESVPFTRYIGISTRQNEIIKEQHRLLS